MDMRVTDCDLIFYDADDTDDAISRMYRFA